MKFFRFLQWILLFGLFLPLLTPLIVSDSTLYPFIFGKAVFFQVVIEILFLVWIIWVVARKNKAKRSEGSRLRLRQWLRQAGITMVDWAVIAFFFVFVGSTLLSPDRLRSFWSTAERMTGLFNLLHFGAWYLMLRTIFKRRSFIWLLRVSLFVSGIVGLYALVSKGLANLQGTLGNVGYVGIYALFHVFFALFLIFKNKETWLWRGAYILLGLFNLVILFLAGVTAPILGLGAGLFIFLCLSIFQSKNRVILIAILSIFIIIALLIAYLFPQQTLGVKDVSQFFKVRSAKTRLMGWQIGWQAFKERPVLGWGPENFILAFAKHFDPDWPFKKWYDKAHNMAVEYLVTTGILGLLAYLGLFISAFWQAVKRRLPILGGLLVAYFITSLFWIDTTAVLIFFFALLALLAQKNEPAPKDKPAKRFDGTNPKKYCLLFIVPFLVWAFFWGNIKPLTATQSFSNGQIKSALAKNTFLNHEMRKVLAEEAGKSDKFAFVSLAAKQMEKNIEERPLDVKSHILISYLYYYLGSEEKLKRVINRAQQLAPNRPDVQNLDEKLLGEEN